MPELDLLSDASVPAPLRAIIEAAPTPGLDASPRDPATSAAIGDFIRSSPWGGTLIESALWLLAGDLDRSHTLSQQFDSREGSYWHGIMHRREGDFSNAKYWFRRVGDHPVLSRLRQEIETRRDGWSGDRSLLSDLLRSDGLAATLVDECQSALEEDSSRRADLQRVTWWEWQLLFDHTLQQSSG